MSARTDRLREIAVLTLIIMLLGLWTAPPANAGTGYRARLLRLVNASRERHDLRKLRIDRSLSRDAMRHTRRMVRRDVVYDPRNLAKMLEDEPWERAGASVVGCADTLHRLHRAWMKHGPHRDILLSPKLRRIGIGVVQVDGQNACGRRWFWATELFYG